MPLRFTEHGVVIISPEDDPDLLTDTLVSINYPYEFCVSLDFSPAYAAALMAAGFLVMSAPVPDENSLPAAILLPKMHKERSVIFFPELHIKKSVRRILSRYELRVDEDFPAVLQQCADTHGEDWLTPALRRCFEGIAGGFHRPSGGFSPKAAMRCFSLYREGRLVAGEFGAAVGRVYTSYSGFHTESSAGTAQMILSAMYLEKSGYAFWDLGMPLEYKGRLGARLLDQKEFVSLFRNSRKW